MAPGGPARPRTVWLLIFLLVFLGTNALVGGGAFIVAPDGHLIGMPMSNLDRAPFHDFRVPGILLALFLGIYPIAVAYGLWKRPGWRWAEALDPFKGSHWSWAASLAAGVTAIVWILVQVQWITFGALHAFVLVWGALIVLVALLPGVRRYCAA